MATTKVVTVVDSSLAALTNPTFNYSAIEFLPDELATQSQQLGVYITRANTNDPVLLTETADYTLNTSTKILTMDAGVDCQENDIVTIERETDTDSRYIDFSGLAFLDSEAVDNNGDNLLHICQELEGSLSDALVKTVDQTAWQGQGLPSTNCSPATDATGWVTLSQANALIAGAEIAEITNVNVKTFTGDGSTTTFGLMGFPATDVDPEKLFVTLDGVTQLPTTDYGYSLVGGTPTLELTTAPPLNAVGLARAIEGAVQTTILEDSINGNAIIDATVDPAALKAASGSGSRFIVFDTAGDMNLTTITGPGNIVDFNVDVRANRLDQMAAPAADISINSNKLTNVGTGTASTDGVNLGQVNTLISAATGVAGSGTFSLPSGSAQWTTANTSQSATGLTAGTYAVFVNVSASAGPNTVSCGGVERILNGFDGTLVYIVTTTGTITASFTSGGATATIRSMTGFRLS